MINEDEVDPDFVSDSCKDQYQKKIFQPKKHVLNDKINCSHKKRKGNLPHFRVPVKCILRLFRRFVSTVQGANF
jgi:hypothetical protein